MKPISFIENEKFCQIYKINSYICFDNVKYSSFKNYNYGRTYKRYYPRNINE